MSTSNPTPDTPHSAAPGVPQTPTKATWAAIAALVTTFIATLYATVQGRTDLDSLDGKDWAVILLGTLASTLAAGGAAYTARNKATGAVYRARGTSSTP